MKSYEKMSKAELITELEKADELDSEKSRMASTTNKKILDCELELNKLKKNHEDAKIKIESIREFIFDQVQLNDPELSGAFYNSNYSEDSYASLPRQLRILAIINRKIQEVKDI